MDIVEKKEYVNARFQSVVLQYAMLITMLLIGPLGLLYAFLKLLASSQYEFTGAVILLLIIGCIGWGGALISAFLLRKYWVFKIATNDTGVTVYGFLKMTHARWSEIASMEMTSTGALFGGNMVKVKTNSGVIYFPITMKDRNKEYPKLDLLGEKWVDSNGNKKPLSPENCSLCQEIQRYISA